MDSPNGGICTSSLTWSLEPLCPASSLGPLSAQPLACCRKPTGIWPACLYFLLPSWTLILDVKISTSFLGNLCSFFHTSTLFHTVFPQPGCPLPFCYPTNLFSGLGKVKFFLLCILVALATLLQCLKHLLKLFSCLAFVSLYLSALRNETKKHIVCLLAC